MGDLPVKILVYSFLMCLGLAISQYIPQAEDDEFGFYVRLPAGIALSYIIVHVGLDFEIVKWRLPTYALDFFVATSAALVPLLVVFGYLKYVCGSHSLPHAWYVEEPLGTSQGLLLSGFSRRQACWPSWMTLIRWYSLRSCVFLQLVVH